ncbi:C3HC zinc finger-like-domain-containing protein [Dactylonectria estremocensis]|uniref:C3HC zinc finger-like-domain-containing protein n=1 Tax=Dactylonectria estremocensis TaxID=1079267 RepID=A0A9P9F2X2_9HYPO|nr:C3HC zinc finger-like-domain-containing protein [Dactylonectria estremocensis]
MNATKRKFNTLLQGLGSSRPKTAENLPSTNNINSSPASRTAATASPKSTPTRPTTAAVNDDLLQKRRRLGLPDSTAPALGKTASPSATIKTVVQKSQTNVVSKDAPAKYSPSDRADLLRRLSTFQEITDWTPKPERVSEVEWAKRGWVCHGKETVRCLLCHRELVVKLNRKLVDGKEIPVLVASEIEDALVDKYADLIVTSHKDECLWRKRGCDDSLLRLSLTNAGASLEALRQRYDDLCSRKAFLPYQFNLRVPDDLNLDEIIRHLPPDFFSNPTPVDGSPNQHPNRVALALALLGWQGLSNARIGSVPNSASCHTCLRRLGLWMFKSKEVADGEILVPAPMDFLDPLREHRFFCPWSNADTQKRGGRQTGSEGELPGWKILVQTLANDSHLRGVYEGRPSARARPKSMSAAPSTPRKPGTAISPSTPQPATPTTPATAIGAQEIEEDEKERDAKDKERWARLRRVKSLFDSKGTRKLRHSISRPISRPGTGHSSKSTTGQKE